MRGQGAVAYGDLDFGREEGQLAALADQGPAAVRLIGNVLDLHAAFQRRAQWWAVLSAFSKVASGAGFASPITSFASTPRRRSLSAVWILQRSAARSFAGMPRCPGEHAFVEAQLHIFGRHGSGYEQGAQ